MEQEKTIPNLLLCFKMKSQTHPVSVVPTGYMLV